MSSGSASEAEEQCTDLSIPEVTTKYRAAADIANEALKLVVEECRAGRKILDICTKGDELITTRTSVVYNKREKGQKIDKGIAFPTCLSVNEVCGHYSPLEDDETVLKDGDVVKIDLGCHINGYMAVAAHTVVVGATKESPVTGKKADAVAAAWHASQAALRLVKEGLKGQKVTDTIVKIVEDEFKCKCVFGAVTEEMKKGEGWGNKAVPSYKTGENEKVKEVKFEPNEVYGIDVAVSTGEGKPKPTDMRPTVFRRDSEEQYQLKSQTARSFLSEVVRDHPTMHFSLRAFSDKTARKVGVNECLRHELLIPADILAEKPGDFVAQFKMTVLLLPGGTKKVTGLPFDQEACIKSDRKIADEEIVKLLQSSAGGSKKKKKKAGGGGGGKADEADEKVEEAKVEEAKVEEV
eukprot:GHVU01038685.1.p1 GENE.GHVU01038685.1~~GHVU01038685.1.p1  ORF type:complete len:408 (+),score=118.73 GHVU01038685.1:105-1328(+)